MVLSVMIITCPSCATRYSLDDSKIPDDGRQVRCVQCSHVWHQEPSEPENLLSLDEAEAGVSESEVPQLEDVLADAPPADETDDIEAADEEAAVEEAVVESDDIEIGEPDEDPDRPAEDDAAESDTRADEATDNEAPAGSAGSSAWRSVRERVVEPVAEEQTKRSDIVGWTILGVLVAAVIASVIFFRSTLEEAWPPSQRFYTTIDGWLGQKEPEQGASSVGQPAPASAYQNVSISIKTSRIAVVNGERVLMIEGVIKNSGSTVATVPNLRGSLKGSKGETLYSWDFSVPFMTIAADTEQEFETSVIDPPAGATSMNLDPVTQN